MKNRSNGWMNTALLLFAVMLAVTPLLLIRGSDFAGSDDKAEAAIQEIQPAYQPWFTSVIELPGGEIETLLFSVQAAAGAGVIGYVIGFYRGRSVRRDEMK